MFFRTSTMLVLLLQLVWATTASAQVTSIEGTYRDPTLGYSIRIPSGLKGITGDPDGPERGIRIPLSSDGKIVVFGEPNSAEYNSPKEGAGAELELKGCDLGKREVKPVLVGKLKGAKGALTCGDRELVLPLAFRPRGGPIYWLQIETVRSHQPVNEAILETIASSFRLIPWT